MRRLSCSGLGEIIGTVLGSKVGAGELSSSYGARIFLSKSVYRFVVLVLVFVLKYKR
jgi:hypothetical protein